MLTKLENKTQNGTILYIELLIINRSTYVYNIYYKFIIYIYAVCNRIKHMLDRSLRANRDNAVPTAARYRTRIGRVQYSINAFMTPFYFEKSYYIEA